MAINNRHDFLNGFSGGSLKFIEHLILGRNRQLDPGTYTPNYDALEFDVATFVGTAGRDTSLGGGGEVFTFFLGSAGNDLYGVVDFTEKF